MNPTRKDGCALFLPAVAKGKSVILIPIDQIAPSPWQARREFDEQELSALAVSIQENGLLQPVSVLRTAKDRYTLIAGERRLRAAKLCGMEKLPAILSEYEENAAAVLSLEENLQRAQLRPFEEADAMKQLICRWGCTQTEAAARLGLSQSALANKLRLLTLSQEIRTACEEARLTERHIRALLRLPEEAMQKKVIDTIIHKQLTVAATERMVESMLRAAIQKPKRKTMVKDVRIFVNTVDHAISLMKNAGIPASMCRTDTKEYIEYVVRIPTV